MLRRRFFGRPFLGRRIVRAGFVAGLGYLAGRSSAASSSPPGASETMTVERRLAELDRLRASGAITDAEYDAQRTRILGSL